jgi:hypothetical protein
MEEALPLLALLDVGQCKRNGLMVRVQQQQDGIAHDRSSLLVDFPDQIAGPPHPRQRA